MNKRLHHACEERKKLIADCEALLAKIDNENRDFNATEQELFDLKNARLSELRKTIDEEMAASAYVTTTAASDFNPDRPIGGQTFTSQKTGELIKTLKYGEPMCQTRFNEPAPAGRLIHSWLTGSSDRPELSAEIGRGGVDTNGGYLFTPQLGSYITDLARNASVCQRAGAQTVVMESPEMHMIRVASDPTTHWRPEGVAVPASGMTFDRVILKSHVLACIVPITLELLEDAANSAQLIEQVVASAIASEIDRACLCGSGAESVPRGIRYTTGVNEIATVGAPASYYQVSQGVRKILEANFQGPASGLAWIMSGREAGSYDMLVDLNGNPLQPTPWAADVQRYVTNTISTTEGVGADESYMVLGDFSQMLIGTHASGVQVRRLPAGTVTDGDGKSWNAVSQLLEHLVIHTRIDVAVMRPSWFTLLTGVAETVA